MSSYHYQASRFGASLIELPRRTKQILATLTDAALCVLTTWLAICFRFESWVSLSGYQWLAVVMSVSLAIPLLGAFGFYHTVVRYAGKQTIAAALRAVGVYALLYSAIFTAYGLPLVPRTIGLLQPLLLLVSLALVRILASQLLSEQSVKATELEQSPGVLIYGAGNSGQQLAASIRASGQRRVVAFIDDNTSIHWAQIAGIPVYSPLAIHELAHQHDVADVLLAMPSLSRSRRNEILKLLSQTKVAVRTLPRLSDLASGSIAESDLRELNIEDLLGRDPVAPIPELLTKNIGGKIVLVTGAGGSIGSELCRQIARLSPRHLVLLEASEFALYTINEELTAVAQSAGFRLTAILANTQDQARILEITQTHLPDTIFHAAAYKHVPLVERNPLSGLRNNVLGTFYVAQAALTAGVKDMVLISTDKAVRPTNIMGASKRLAEMVLQALAAETWEQPNSTRFCIVRFGNVLGSSGSVIPKFQQQIKAGGPITLTHPEVTRFFMTIPEAAQLVIQAAALHESVDKGAHVYILDMGESVKIIDLAKAMIQISGLKLRTPVQPDGDIAIEITGLRPGEKLFEELLVGNNPQPTSHSKIFKSHEAHPSLHQLKEIIDCITSAKVDSVPLQAQVVRLMQTLGVQYKTPDQ